MSAKLEFCLIVYINFLIYFSSAEYQYLGVRNVNQMEPPSLETMGSLEGKFQHDQEHVQEHSQQSPGTAGLGRSLAGQALPPAGGQPKEKDCDKKDGKKGWRTVQANSPLMRSLELDKKPCNKGGKGRSLDDPNAVAPDIRMLDRKKEETPLKEVQRVQLGPQPDKVEEKDLKPNVREKIESWTEQYMVTSMATRIITRKRVFMQKRKIVNQKINKPIVIIRRKIIKERQIFERIVPKIIETREIINNPTIKSKVVEGPIYEVEQPHAPRVRSLDELEPGHQPGHEPTEDCPEVEFDPESGETVDGAQAVSYQNFY